MSTLKRWRANRRNAARWRRRFAAGVGHGHIYSLRDLNRGLVLATRYESKYVLDVLAKHHPYADHCGGYEVAAWPCRPALFALSRYICEHDGHDRPCAVHDWDGGDDE